MFGQFTNYYKRVKNIGDNPFWATTQSRAARTPTWKKVWRGYAGFFILLILPTLIAFDYAVRADALSSEGGRHTLAFGVCAIGLLQLLYISIKSALATAPSVVQARQQGTLLALALTRINSADFADGVALSESKTLLKEFGIWIPLMAGLAVSVGLSVYSTVVLSLISALLVLYFTYNGILISATSKDTQQANRRATQGSFVSLAGTCLGFICGGFMLGPIWVFHPAFAYLYATWGAGSAYGPSMQSEMSLLVWCGWPMFVLPVYMWMVLNVRQSAIRALERVRIG